MTTVGTNQFRPGLRLIMDGDPCAIIESEFVKPGKGQAFTRVKVRNLKTGRVLDKTCKSGERFEAADVVEREMQYLYQDDMRWYFMDQTSFEQYSVTEAALGEGVKWLAGEELCIATLWNGVPLSIQVPNFVTLRVQNTEPAIKGNTVAGGAKPATLETGTMIRVPLFIEEGERIKIDTRAGEYVARARE